MREAWLRLLLAFLLVAMWIFSRLVLAPTVAVAAAMSKKLDALELDLLMAGAARRTRNQKARSK